MMHVIMHCGCIAGVWSNGGSVVMLRHEISLASTRPRNLPFSDLDLF